MAYGKEDALKTMQGIIDDKQGWQISGNVKHTINGMNAQDYYAQNAQKKYDELIANGYGTIANNLKNSNLEQAKKYVKNYYTKTGRSQFRPYMYEKGKQYGLTSQDIDKMIKYDSETGEITFAGKNIGKPVGIADDRSYFDADYMDEVWNNYVNESGIAPPKNVLGDQMTASAKVYLDKLAEQQAGNRDYIMNTGSEQRNRKDDFIKSQQNADIFKTKTAQTIMDKFNYLGGIAGGDEIASGASSNSGNIDSFSAANRARQQLAYTSAGADAVIAEYQNRMNNVMETLKSIDSQNQNEYNALNENNDTGIATAQQYTDNARQLYENMEIEQKAESSKTANKIAEAEMKGYFTDYSDNPFLNEDGTVKNEDLNFADIYNQAIADGDEKTAKDASEAGYQKIMNNWDTYGKWYDPSIHKPREEQHKPTATVSESDKDRNLNLDLANLDADTQKWLGQLSADTQIQIQELVNQITREGYASNEVVAKMTTDAQKYTADANKAATLGAAETAGKWNYEAAKLSSADNRYLIDANERMNTENNQYSLWKSENDNNTQMFLGGLNYLMNIDANAASKYMSDDPAFMNSLQSLVDISNSSDNGGQTTEKKKTE